MNKLIPLILAAYCAAVLFFSDWPQQTHLSGDWSTFYLVKMIVGALVILAAVATIFRSFVERVEIEGDSLAGYLPSPRLVYGLFLALAVVNLGLHGYTARAETGALGAVAGIFAVVDVVAVLFGGLCYRIASRPPKAVDYLRRVA